VSDMFQGPGWWMASDGRWYSPERHPDEKYRKQFMTPREVPSSAFPSVGLDISDPGVDETRNSPFSEMVRSVTDDEVAVTPQPEEVSPTTNDVAWPALPDDAKTSDLVNDVDGQAAILPTTAAPLVEPASEPNVQRRGFSVASRAITEPSERPVFEHAVPPSVVDAPATQRVVGRTELELELSRAHRAAGITMGRQSTEPAGLAAAPRVSTPMALVHVPGAAAPFHHVTTFDRVIASLVFLTGVAMIVGSFLHWTTGSLEETGWDRGDGIVAVIAGVLGSAAAGPIFVGYRHVVPKLLAVIAGLAGVVAVGFVAIDVLLDEAATGTNLGIGFGVVLVAAITMIGAGLANRGEDRE
jgi:hypothetical protein